MKNWKHKVKIRHLFTENEDHTSIQDSMNKIGDVLESSGLFAELDLSAFRDIPEGGTHFGPVDYANMMLDEMWDLADHKSIWIPL